MSVRERIRVDCCPISEECFSDYFWQLWDRMGLNGAKDSDVSARPQSPGYPSFLVTLALFVFHGERVATAILECGTGGELDSTNAIPTPIATGITKVGLDHVNVLGETLAEIAWHKGGIFKPGAPAFSVPQNDGAVQDMLMSRARERRTCLQFLTTEHLLENRVKVSPNALYQRENAALAIRLATEYISEICPGQGIDVDLLGCIEHTTLPAKFEIFNRRRTSWILSGAHNEMSVQSCTEAFIDHVSR